MESWVFRTSRAAGPRTLEIAARTHRESRWRATVEDCEITVVPAGSAAAVVATGVRADDESGEEDHRDDEDHAGDDADPSGDGAESGTARFLTRGRRDGILR
ncbi:hypothetical protein AU186_18560 [Mycobacterium sp. GA-1999]|nr:hypothetical protein AU186_18560 [Mycobacterium sp. GA-1999]KUH88037.1 hypothetical protein AU185_08675 [Mycobacterium sp. GA-0227b]